MSSAAYWRKRSASPSQRASIRTLRPSVQPSSCNPCRNAIRRRDDSGSVAGSPISTPMRRTRSLCCALAASSPHPLFGPRTATNSPRCWAARAACALSRVGQGYCRRSFTNRAERQRSAARSGGGRRRFDRSSRGSGGRRHTRARSVSGRSSKIVRASTRWSANFDGDVARMAEEVLYCHRRIERLVEVVTKFESLVERRENGSCRNIPWTSGPR
jgi:hypothetical protein